MDFFNKNVLVCGIGKSGISSAVLLKKLNANVTIQDIKELDKLKNELERLEQYGITLISGKNPDLDLIISQDLIVLSPGIPCDLPFIERAKDHNIPIWGEIELAYSLCKSPIVAITGTNGKTTTTVLCGEIFKYYFEGSQVVGNIGVPFTDKVFKTVFDSYIIAEISSFQLETAHSFKPKISAVLNITPDHMDRHKTMENYIKIKKRIFMNQTSQDYLVLNYDDLVCREMKNISKSKVIFFSRLENLESGITLKDNYICIKFDDIDEPLINIKELKILGNHNIENVMAACAISVAAKVPLSIIRQTIKNFNGVEHRLELVAEINGVQFFNDSKGTNPEAAIIALQAMDRKVILIGGGYDKNSDFSNWIKAFENKVKHLIVLGEVADNIINTCKAYEFYSYDKVNSLKEAVDLAFSKSEAGDCVLLSPACASWGMFDNYEQRGNMFKAFVLELRR